LVSHSCKNPQLDFFFMAFPLPPSSAPEKPRRRSPSPTKRVRESPNHGPDPNGLAEFSVVYTNRSLNHMSKMFQQAMRDISASLKEVYGSHSVALVPGSGTFAMEAVARQFGSQQKCLVIRNGYFSYRWSQIFATGNIPAEEIVMRASPVDSSPTPAYAPVALEVVVETIRRERPRVVFAPHVETSSGIMIPESYIKGIAAAVHEVDGLFVLDCIASGCIWIDMAATGVDVLISAPQKGWSSTPCAGIVMLSALARKRLAETTSTCFAVDLKKWVAVMEAYEQGGHMYHTTMPTDSIIQFRNVQQETALYGYERVRQEQLELGTMVRHMLADRGFKSVAADGFHAPGVVVSYTNDVAMKTGAKFAAHGLQIAAGVPLMVDAFTESPKFSTFRLGLFGLDKLRSGHSTVRQLEQALDQMGKIHSNL